MSMLIYVFGVWGRCLGNAYVLNTSNRQMCHWRWILWPSGAVHLKGLGNVYVVEVTQATNRLDG